MKLKINKIVQIDKLTNKVIKIWDHYTEPAEFYNLCSTGIYASVKRDNNETCDMLWTYYNPARHIVNTDTKYYIVFKNNKYYKTFLTIPRIGRDLGLSDEEVNDILANNNSLIYTIKTIN